MKKNFKSVEVVLSLPHDAFVNLRNGIKIFLFSVSLGISLPSYCARDINPSLQTGTQLDSDLTISLDSNSLSEDIKYQNKTNLFSSLESHRIEMMSDDDINSFWSVAEQIETLNFTDSMVCYEPREREVTYDILDKSGLILHLTQYLDKPKEQVVYSIEKDANFLAAGHTHIKTLGVKLQQVIDSISKEVG